MKNIAVIFAGGTGQRMSMGTKPKQFLTLYGKPIIVYTMEVFQKSSDIDAIVLVTLSDWIDYATELKETYELDKIVSIIQGGDSGQKSICNGIMEARRLYGDDNIVLIHDGVRPVIDEELIHNSVETVRQYGASITVSPAIETVITRDEDGNLDEIIDRSRCLHAKAPQSFILGDICKAHEKAMSEGKLDFIDSACLMSHYGHKLHTIQCASDNIKITTSIDYFMFKALVDASEQRDVFS